MQQAMQQSQQMAMTGKMRLVKMRYKLAMMMTMHSWQLITYISSVQQQQQRNYCGQWQRVSISGGGRRRDSAGIGDFGSSSRRVHRTLLVLLLLLLIFVCLLSLSQTHNDKHCSAVKSHHRCPFRSVNCRRKTNVLLYDKYLLYFRDSQK